MVRLSIAQKLNVLAAFAIFFTVLTGSAGYYGVSSNRDAFVEYRQLSLAQKAVANIGEDFIQARLAALKYRISSDPAQFDSALANFQEIKIALDELDSFIIDENIHRDVSQIASRALDYEKAILVMRGMPAVQIEAHFTSTMDVIGPQITQGLDAVQNSLERRQDELGPQATVQTNQTSLQIGVFAALAILSSIIFSVWINRSIHLQLNGLAMAMRRINDEQIYDSNVPGQEQPGSIGVISNALVNLQAGLFEKQKLEEKQSMEDKEKRHLEEQESEFSMAGEFKGDYHLAEQLGLVEAGSSHSQLAIELDGEVSSILDDVSSSIEDLRDLSIKLNTIAEEIEISASPENSETDKASSIVSEVSTAAEEMTNSIDEIRRQMERASGITKSAISQVSNTGSSLGELSMLNIMTQSINDGVNLISDIAAQTNLLALNVTIEAARAGDSGRGFAVMSSEIKAVATQTEQAIEEITKQISAVRVDAEKVTLAVSGVVETG